MSDAIIVAIIAALPGTLAAMVALKRLTNLHVLLNSRLDKMLEEVRRTGNAEGREAQRQESLANI